MTSGTTDQLAQTRFDNAMTLFDEFVRSNVRHADAATLRGLEGRFAQRLQIQPSYWSQIKGRSRQIGERLARQFELLCRKPPGWMDEAPGQRPGGAIGPGPRRADAAPLKRPGEPSAEEAHVPIDDDERFIVGLVLTYYRRHPQRARTRLLELLGEVLLPDSSPMRAPASTAGQRGHKPTVDDGDALWARSQAGVARLKQKR